MRIIPYFWAFMPFWLSAQGLLGEWEGYLDQSRAAANIPGYQVYFDKGYWERGKPSHGIKMRFEEKEGKIEGIYYLYTRLRPDNFGEFSLEAELGENSITYRTKRLIQANEFDGMGFCFNRAKLHYRVSDGYEYLEGTWRGWSRDNGRPCADSYITLRRALPQKQAQDTLPRNEPLPAVKAEPLAEYEVGKTALDCGQALQLSKLRFRDNSEKFESMIQAREQLDPISLYLRDNPQTRLRLSGHSDVFGSRERNMELSRLRVLEVQRWFSGMGIDPKRIDLEWFGPDRPIHENGSPLNRRVEMRVLCED